MNTNGKQLIIYAAFETKMLIFALEQPSEYLSNSLYELPNLEEDPFPPCAEPPDPIIQLMLSPGFTSSNPNQYAPPPPPS